MTTLSKEDVVRTDNDLLAMIQKHFPSLPLDDRYTDWGKWLRFAKAVYSHGEQAARADLVAENERLNELVSTREDDVRCEQNWVRHWHSEAETLRTALAAVEARETKLREIVSALETKYSLNSEIRELCCPPPADDSALREMIAGVYEECAKVCEAMNYINTQPHHCADAIRALAEKAKGE